MTVSELIAKLQEMPANAEVRVYDGGELGDTKSPEPEQVWNDHAENYLVVL